MRVRVFVGVVVASVLAAPMPAGAAPSWTLVGTAAGAAYGHIASVSCPTSTSCIAVGIFDKPHSVTRGALRWNGKQWLALTTPSPAGAVSSQLTGVACTSTSSCIAVGQYNNPATVTKTMIMRWDGAHWTMLPSPNAPGASVSVLTGVACASSTSCFAVGSAFISTLDTSQTQTLIERWNGTTWSIVPSPNQPLANDSTLTGVSCAGVTSCFAVGTYDTELVTSTLTERWDGTTWSIVPSANPASSTDNELISVTCTSSVSCTAVGTGHGTLVELWNGSIWTIVTSANPTGATGASLTGIACPSATRCVAVGDIFRRTVVQRLVETWNGRSWSIVTVPIPTGTKLSNLSGVSCATATSCFAVGDFRLGPTRRPLFERYS